MENRRISRWRRYHTDNSCRYSHQHALRKNKRVYLRVQPSAIGMTPRESMRAEAAGHDVTLVFVKFGTLLQEGRIQEHEPGIYDSDTRKVYIVEELPAEYSIMVVREALYVAAFVDYLETRTVIGARQNLASREKISLGLLSWLALIGWELCSPQSKNPLKEKQNWEMCLRWVRTRFKVRNKAQKLPKVLRSLRLRAKRSKARN